MAQIFISHAREDHSRAKALAIWLESEGWTVWWDQELLPGESFRAAIEQQLEASRCILVLWSRDSVKSHWVTDEAQVGAERSILVPVLLDDSIIPIGFRQIQAARLPGANWKGSDPNVHALRRSIVAIVGSSARKHTSGGNTAKTGRSPILTEPDEDLPEEPATLHASKLRRWVALVAVMGSMIAGGGTGWAVASRFTDIDWLMSAGFGVGGMLAVWLLTVAFPWLKRPPE